MRKLSVLIVVAGSVGLSSTAAYAQEESTDQQVDMETGRMMDSNKDGIITPAEFERLSSDSAQWDALDTNQDGMLDASEQRSGFARKPLIRK